MLCFPLSCLSKIIYTYSLTTLMTLTFMFLYIYCKLSWTLCDKISVYKPSFSSKIIINRSSFLNCDWLLIREVQWSHWTQELLVPVEKFSVRMMQYTNWINSTPSQQQLLSCIAQWLEHSVCNRGVASSSPIIGINRSVWKQKESHNNTEQALFLTYIFKRL